MNVRKVMSLMVVILLGSTGCATTQYGINTGISNTQAESAKHEIQNSTPPVPVYISDEDAEKKVYEIYGKLLPVAVSICRSMGENSACSWDIYYSSKNDLNAFAAGSNKVVIQRGVLRYAKTDDEIAAVIAHELSHHAANHIQEGIDQAQTGMIVGALLGGLAGAIASNNTYDPGTVVASGAIVGGALGSKLAEMNYSVNQELEADYLALYILHNSGYDVTAARNMLINIAKISGRSNLRSASFDSHPTPPERLAQWDIGIQEVRESKFTMPQKISQSTSANNANPSSESFDFITSKQDCDVAGGEWEFSIKQCFSN